MKQKLLFFALLSTLLSLAKTPVANPSIGITTYGLAGGPGFFYYYINIKNTGEETLTNVYVTDYLNFGPPTQFTFNPIASMVPGEELLLLQAYRSTGGCFDQIQFEVHATTASSTQITDLSSDMFTGGDYYNDSVSYASGVTSISGTQEGTYADLNTNNIVDVGDAINYTYTVNNSFWTNTEIVDNNATVANPFATSTTGIHYLTQADIALGYVYNQSHIMTTDPCFMGEYFTDPTPCGCPNPNGYNIVTSLSDDLPNIISGTVKFDLNNDNCATGLSFPNKRVSTTDGTYTYSTYTNVNGDYHIYITHGQTFTTTTAFGLNPNFSSNPTSVVIASQGGSAISYNNTNFCIGSATNFADLEVYMYNMNQAMPGNVATYTIYYRNNGSTALNGTIQLTYENGKLSFINSNPSQNSTTANTISWNYSNLLPCELRHITLAFNVATPPTVNTNDHLNFTAMGTPMTGDADLSNNTFGWTQTVRSSFDPNDKTVIEGDAIDIGQTDNYLHYITRFQNTGTANATTVVIKETLDPNLDWNTFEPIDSSHESYVQIKNGNELTYTFSNIDLPYEAANEPASHGWMAYRIKPKSNIALWDTMSSSSNIYFDYNLPVPTNTVSTQVRALSTTDFIKSNFTVYPNPASNYITIKAEANVDAQYEILDINGKKILSNTVESMNPININALQSGFYFLTIKTSQGQATYKVIKN